jgi:hypothetical protein
MKTIQWALILLFVVSTAHASLSVKMDDPKITGNKAVIKLTMQNTYGTTVESARVAVFLKDEKGKVIGQKAEWVIGGSKDKPALAPNTGAEYFLMVPADKPFQKTDVIFTRIILEGGQVIQAGKGFQLEK